MVSTEKYLTTFFVVMKQRFEVLQQLTTEKQKINGLILSGQHQPKDIERLMDLIGRDILFRKAEKRDKPTLRHLNWKITKSLKNLQKFNSSVRAKDIIPQFMNDILSFKNFFDSILPKIIDLLEESDKVYQSEVETLNNILHNTQGVQDYKDMLKKEEIINEYLSNYLSKLRARSMVPGLIILLKKYYKFVKYQRASGRMPIEVQEICGTTSALILYVLASIALYLTIESIGSGEFFKELHLYKKWFGTYFTPGVNNIICGVVFTVTSIRLYKYTELSKFIKLYIDKMV